LALKIHNDPYFQRFLTRNNEDASLRPNYRIDLDDDLSIEAETLFLEAASSSNGEINLSNSNNETFFLINRKQYGDYSSPKVRANWLGALEELKRNYLFDAFGIYDDTFKINREGYSLAEEIISLNS
jgi:hypothetical protein